MISNILLLLREILKEMEKNNPYELIGKGGTILSIYHLNHRESQDLDFDCLSKYKEKDFQKYFYDIFQVLKTNKKIKDLKINKVEMATTGRFHMSVTFYTHKQLPQTKIDINFLDKIPDQLLNQKEFKFYSLEALFTHKLMTFASREAIKDIIDIGKSINKISPTSLDNDDNINIINNVIEKLENIQKNPKIWKTEFSQTSLKFRDIKMANFPGFLKNTIQNLYILRNRIQK